MTEVSAKQIFDPYLDWIRLVWQEGWKHYHKVIAHPDDDHLARSVNIQNRAIIFAKSTCEKFGVSHFRFHKRHLFRFGEGPIVQFKKLSDDFLPINNVTPTADAFDRQEPIPGLDDVPRITAGYHPNEMHTDYSLYLVLPKSHYAFNWILPISSQQQLISLDLPNEPIAPPSTPARVRVKGTTLTLPPDESAVSA